MASIVTHTALALALGKAVTAARVPRAFWIWMVALSVGPDLDVIGFALGVEYGDLFGHRGLTHSIPFAIVAGGIASLLARAPLSRGKLWLLFSATMASHGLLDALTNGGLGVAFFSPFDTGRYFLPFTPVEVSPIGARAFLGRRGLAVLASELVWIWLPCAALWIAARLVTRLRR